MELDLKIVYELAEINGNMTDIERLTTIYAFLSSQFDLGVEGDLVEVGYNAGYTSAFLQMVNLAHGAGTRQLHVYDSFQGLPAPSPFDSYLSEGELEVSADTLRKIFHDRGLPLPRIHEGWFDQTLPTRLPEKIAFAYLDGDFYESILVSLTEVVPRLAPGGVVIVDDYCDREAAPRSWDGLPGVRAACEEYFRDRAGRQALVGVGDLSFLLYRKPVVKEGL